MNDIVRSALGLPPGSPWPPDQRKLVGLGDGEINPTIVEAAVMQRMERLRNYQLAHPDEVTEAMNCLARALVDLTRPAAPVHTLPQPEPFPLAPEPPAIVADDSPPDLPVTAPVLDLLPEEKPEFEIRLPFKDLRKEPPSPPPQVVRPVPRYRLHNEEPVQARPVPEVALRPLSPRRAAVRNIVRYRRLLQSWDTAGAFLTQHGIADSRRADAIRVIIALRDIETSPWAVKDREPGGSVLRLAQSRPSITSLWEMPLADREMIREDWRVGRVRLLKEYQRLRRAFKRPRPARELLQTWNRVRQFVPHLTVVAASIAAIIIGVVRMAQ